MKILLQFLLQSFIDFHLGRSLSRIHFIGQCTSRFSGLTCPGKLSLAVHCFCHVLSHDTLLFCWCFLQFDVTANYEERHTPDTPSKNLCALLALA